MTAFQIRTPPKFVSNDVIFLRDKDVETKSRLSEVLTVGCEDSHWVGDDNRSPQP